MIIIKPGREVYIVFGAIYLFTIVIGLIGYLPHKDNSFLWVNCLFFGAAVLTFVWISYHIIRIRGNTITFGRLAALQRSLSLDEIYDWYTWIGLRDDHGHTGPFVRLVIEPKPESGKKAIILPLKFYSDADFQKLKKFLDQVPIPPKGKNKGNQPSR